MQELKKILEEIEKGTHTFELLGRDVDFVAIDWVRDVIRKHMNDDNEIMEQCPYCENEAALHWDVEKDGHQVFCPNCGKPMMLCSMCDARDGAVCDWKEGEGCKHSDERYRDYFRSHMNDGWIPVEKEWPPFGQRLQATILHHEWISDYDSSWVPEKEKIHHAAYIEVCEIHPMGAMWCYACAEDDYHSDIVYIETVKDLSSPVAEIIAWRPLPAPYQPERSDNHDGE